MCKAFIDMAIKLLQLFSVCIHQIVIIINYFSDQVCQPSIDDAACPLLNWALILEDLEMKVQLQFIKFNYKNIMLYLVYNFICIA